MGYGWQQRNESGGGSSQRGMLTVGIFLVLVGLFFLATEALNFDFERYGWPMFVIVPGALLLMLGLAISHEGGLGAAIPGGIITTVGLLLAFQNATDTYASWVYAWALVLPGAVGVTLVAWGLLHRRWDLVDAGLRAAAVGLGLFVVLGLFFENILGVSASGTSTVLRDALPMVAIGLGALIVIYNLLPEQIRKLPASNTWSPPQSPYPPGGPPAPPAER